MFRKSLLTVFALLIALLVGVAGAGAAGKTATTPATPAATGKQSGNQTSPAAATGSAFTYQGRLTSGGNVTNGNYDLNFSLWDGSSGGAQVGSTVSMANQSVTNGLFTVSLDFGASAFQGSARWLQMAVRQTGGGSFTTLAPRQPLTAAPYAMSLMPGAMVAGTVASPLLSLNNAGGAGVYATTTNANSAGVSGQSANGTGVKGASTSGAGGYFTSTSYIGAWGQSTSNIGVQGQSSTSDGVFGVTDSGNGVYGISGSGNGVEGQSTNGDGVHAISTNGYGVYAQSGSQVPAIYGLNTNNAAGVMGQGGQYGVRGYAPNGYGVFGQSNTSHGVFGTSGSEVGVYGLSNTSDGVYGGSTGGDGVHGATDSGKGVYGISNSGNGVEGNSTTSYGVFGSGPWGVAGVGANDGVIGQSTSATGSGVYGYTFGAQGTGVYGENNYYTGVYGTGGSKGVWGNSTGGYGIYGRTQGNSSVSGVYGTSSSIGGNGVIGEANNGIGAYGVWGKSSSGYAGYFSGNVQVNGTLSKSAGSFKIDDPIDPANKYLSHSFVESPDMMNIYNGNITTDGKGDATVTMPAWFEPLNQDFRYQLTAMGQFAQAIVSAKMKDNHFSIKTDKPNVEVSWQVTGIRHDAYADAHRIPVEENKPASEQGYYLHPELYGQPDNRSMENSRPSSTAGSAHGK